MDATLELDINGSKYQVVRMKAKTGSFLLTTLLTKVLPSALSSGGDIASLLPQLSEGDFELFQGHALEACRKFNGQGIAEPIFLRPDRWAIKELEYDLNTVLQLTMESLMFNLSPFFSDGGLIERLLSNLPAGMLPTS